MAGKNVGVDSEADVCVMKELDDPLLVHIERSSYIAPLPNAQRQQSAEPQIIAGAIAAYYQNNLRRTQVGLPALPAVLMPGITIHGTRLLSHPRFAPTPGALATSTYPKEETIVLRFIPPVANPETYFSDGIRPLGQSTYYSAMLRSLVSFQFDLSAVSYPLRDAECNEVPSGGRLITVLR